MSGDLRQRTQYGWLGDSRSKGGEMTHTPGPWACADFTEDELQLILVEQMETFAESDLRTLIELGQYERVKRIIERLQEKMPKRIT
jgi:hypothetical protein